ncbi:glycosyltransferase family 2 protein [Sutcliffiella horikoshii]|uniref:Glycosyltransferase family 2 protein n=1 Tax=Sutcliffiella horikoshii TaxID=79883 RepID=A0AA94WQ15_9BACI|nr:glycosyltransferase family A protein [Sutcliffiella horikoshii]TYS60298.1 glycosyltransferase family 2 protein [Sutcliffiella horikoshii]
MKQYAENDARINLNQLEIKSGAAVARYTAIQAENGKYVVFLDRDDMWVRKNWKFILKLRSWDF